MFRNLRWLAFALLASSVSGFAAAEAEGDRDALRKLADSLNYQKGHIVLKEGLASVNVPEGFRYLSPQDAATVLTKIWGNPPGESSLGMLLPAGVSPADGEAWAAVITYREDGYVKDSDASSIDYAKELKTMQEATLKESEERVAQHFDSIALVGWAKPPRYDQANHKLYWAKELKFGGSPYNTLNYDIRMLGRRGVLELKAVAGMEALPQIEENIPGLLQMVDFQEGHRYADFNPSTDKVATYGLAALVTGGILAKAGFFKLLVPALLAAKKFVLIGVIAIVTFVKKLFGKKAES